jgi:membrane-associated phospholipid phosphatase
MSKWERFILYPLFLAAFIVFSFYDWQVSSAFVGSGGDFVNGFGRFFAVFAEVPFQWLLVFCLVILFRFRSKDSKKKAIGFGILFGVLGVLAAAYGGYVYYAHLEEFTDKTLPVMVFMKYGGTALIAVCYLALAVFFAYRLPADNSQNLVYFALCDVLLFVTMVILMQGLKMLWGRPRYRFLITTEDPAGSFASWWQLHPTYHLTDDNHFSFPSGHTMFAFSFIIFSAFPFKGEEYPARRRLIRYVVFGWTLLTAIARIQVGAHFGTDVTMGYFLGYLVYDLYSTFLFPHLRKKLIPAPKEA